MKNKLLLITLISILIVPFVLSAEYSISGTISFSVGGVATPAEGALVELRDINNILIGENQVTTLNDGAYLFILDDTLIPGAPPKIVVATMPNYPEVGEKFKLTNAYAVNNIISLTFDYACPDSDLDTYFADWCGGNDCNDNEALINPAALDNTDDDVDNDCDGLKDEDVPVIPPVGDGSSSSGGGGGNSHPVLITPVVQETRTLEQPVAEEPVQESNDLTGAVTAETGAGNYLIAGLIILVLLVAGYFLWKKYK
ncbi:hypothetical protein J4427_03065 [Candidatus Woesearchaeota archaeon]|nr:hypothetical protein [Candidatus Woesearchaeota archaeon]